MFAALALLGCNNEPTPNVLVEPQAISFGTNITRAEAGMMDLQSGGFGVWAFVNNNTLSNDLLMENVHVEYEGEEWVYSPVKYWIPDSIFSFVGVYPYNDPSYSTDAENAAVKLTVSETPSQTDYLVATNVTDTGDVGLGNVVDLQFQHILTSVCLNIWRDQAKHTSDQMRIRRVTLGNIIKSGVYSSATESWTYNNNDKLALEMVNNENLSDTDNIGAAMLQDNGTLETGGTPAAPFGTMMLLPQTLDSANSVPLKIVYELKRQNAADWESAELETVLPNMTWNSGQRYTYNVVLSSVTDITVYYIQTKVDPWGTPQVGGTVIIK